MTNRLVVNRFFSKNSIHLIPSNRCRIWIGKTQRFDLLDKANIHDERICQQHFDATMFLNESQNRLHQYAIPSLYLTTKPPPIQSSALDNLLANGLSGIEHVLSVSYLVSVYIYLYKPRESSITIF